MDSTLAQRMREAADILVLATQRYHSRGKVDAEYIDWRPANLRTVADDFEAEDQVKDGLAQIIYDTKTRVSTDVAQAILDKFNVTPKRKP